MKSRTQALAEFDSFVRGIGPSDRVAMIHHKDGDGMCSAIVCAIGLEHLTRRAPAAWIPASYGIFSNAQQLLHSIRSKNCNKIICMDLNIDQAPDLVREMEKNADHILIVDHHKILHNLDSSKTVMIKAQFLDSSRDSSQYPNAKMMFDLFSGLTDMSDAEWQTLVGMASDMGLDAWPEFVQAVLARRNITRATILETNEIVAAVECVAEERFLELGKAMWKASSPADILSGPWKSYRDEFENEISRWMAEFETHAIRFSDLELAIVEINPRFAVRSPLANRISLKNPHTTVVIIDLGRKEKAIFSMRRQDFKIKMNDLIEQAIQGIPGASGGGHIPAGAGNIPKTYVDQFRQNLVNILGEIYAQTGQKTKTN